MGGKTKKRRESNESEQKLSGKEASANKRRKVEQLPISEQTERPKSKKELRLEKKAEKKAARTVVEEPSSPEPLSKKEKQRLRKEKRKELLKEQLREERREKKIRQQKRLNREINAPKKHKKQQQSDSSSLNKKSEKSAPASKKTAEKASQEDQVAMKVLSEVIHGSMDETTGMTTLKLGVQYKDLVVGDGALVKTKSLVTVQYKLTGGKFGAVLDSSKKFNFRVGKGEVIQGWDIGLVGMREGGRRKLIVPPKAGYGSQDIGAGAGALLYFDISVRSVRGGN